MKTKDEQFTAAVDRHCGEVFENRLRCFAIGLSNRMPDFEAEASQLAQQNQSDEAHAESMFESLGGAIRGTSEADMPDVKQRAEKLTPTQVRRQMTILAAEAKQRGKAIQEQCPHRNTTHHMGTPYDSSITCDDCGKELP